MKTRRIARIALAAVLGILLVLGLTSCRCAAERIFERTTGISVDEEGERITVTGEEGEEMQIETGSASLPTGWPGDMPVYANADIENSTSYTTGEGTQFSIGLSTSDSFEGVFDWYRSELVGEGWTIENEVSMETDGARSGHLYASKGSMESYTWFSEENGGVTISSQVMQPQD